MYLTYNETLILTMYIRNVPGYAFKNSFPYLELNELELSKLASNEIQKQFYQVIIKTGWVDNYPLHPAHFLNNFYIFL